VCVCGETTLFLSFFFALEKCGECEKKTFLRFFSLSSLPFFILLLMVVVGCIVGIFFFSALVSNRNGRKEKREEEKKDFSLFFSSLIHPIKTEIKSSM
jgi:membrane protein insertase Oxa1/YidC/SpoIIIJ